MSTIWYAVAEPPNVPALDAALRAALDDDYAGLSFGAVDLDGSNLQLHFHEGPTSQAITTARLVADAHDPVHLSVDKATIAADGVDEATITVRAASPVTLDVGGVAVAVELADGVGEVGLTSADPRTIRVRVQDADNRCAQVLEVRAV